MSLTPSRGWGNPFGGLECGVFPFLSTRRVLQPPFFYAMINAEQIRRDFEKKRNPLFSEGELPTLGFNGETAVALKTNIRKSVTIDEIGEAFGELFALRFLDTDFTTIPTEKDVVTVDGVEYQVGEIAISGFGAVYKIICLDVDV